MKKIFLSAILLSAFLIAAIIFIISPALADTPSIAIVYADNVTAGPIILHYTINDTGTGHAILEILGSDNRTVRAIDCGERSNGPYSFLWDGKDNNGTMVQAGNYTVKIVYSPDDYSASAKWGSAGTGMSQFMRPSGLAVDSEGDIYVAEYDNDRIQKFDASGRFLTAWGSKGDGDGQFDYPAGIAVDGLGDVYVVDYGNSRVEMFTSDGDYLTQWGSQGSGDGQFNMPHGIAVDRNDNVYVADMGNHRIQKFSATGKYLGGWGSKGRGNGLFINPIGVAASNDGTIYVTDPGTNRIQRFTNDGSFLGGWGITGSGPGQLNGASSLAVDNAGYIYVSDIGNHQVQKFNTNGTPDESIKIDGDSTGSLSNPSGIAVGSSGTLYVTDISNDDLQKFTYDPGRENTLIENSTNLALTTNQIVSAMAYGSSLQYVGPVTTVSLSGTAGNNSWYRSNVTATLTAYDNSGSGIKLTNYSFDNKTWNTYTAPFNINNEGTTTINYYSVDNQSNMEPVKTTNVRIDRTPPVVQGYATTDPLVDGWYKGIVTVHFIANDSLSGVISLTPDQTISTDGPGQVVEGTATDLAGNVGKADVILNIDNTPPLTMCLLNGTAGNGWYRSDVQVNFSATDGDGSGVKKTEYSLDGSIWKPATPFIINKEGSTTVYYRSTDEVGNVEIAGSTLVMIDKTPPTITGAPLTQPVNGWYTNNVVVHFTATDAYSGVSSVTPDQTLTADGAYQSVIGTATDNAGNTASTIVSGINIDSNPPVTTCSLSGDGGGTGDNTWYRTNVSVTLSASDAGSGVRYTMYSLDDINWQEYHPFTISNEGITQIYYYSVDNVGFSEIPKTCYIRIDKTAPVIKGMIITQPNADGWYTDTVIVHFIATDDSSGIGSVTPDIYLASDGPNQSVTGYASDMAGNTASVTISGINIDMKPPVTMCTLNATPDSDGWFNGDVTANLSASDNAGDGTNITMFSLGGSKWQVYQSPIIINKEGNNVLYYYSTDKEDNVEPMDAQNIKIDKTPPDINYIIFGGNTVNGIYTQNVTVHFIASDSVSGIKNITQDIILTNDCTGQVVNGTATDLAGNSVFVSTQPISIDRTPPVTTCTLYGTMGNNGWYTSPVSVILSATDGNNGTGVKMIQYSLDNITWSPYTSLTIGANGNHMIYYRSIDEVNNTEAIKTISFKIDTIAPYITGIIMTKASPYGWYNSSVTVHFNASDLTSGVASVSPDQTLSNDGINQVVEGNATDKAGNTATYDVSNINIDRQIPNTTCMISGTQGNSGWYISNVNVNLSAVDLPGAILATHHSIDNVNWYDSTLFAVPNEGNTTIYYYSVDRANNTEPVKSISFKIDMTPPYVVCNINGTMGANGYYRSAVSVSFTATDSGSSGLASAQYSLDGTSWKNLENFSISNDGSYNIRYRANDTAGNAMADSRLIVINQNAPVVNDTAPAINAEGMYVDGTITAGFNEPMDPSTINNSTFTLMTIDGNPVNGTVRYVQNGTQSGIATFQPANNLEPATMYTASVSTGVKSLAGNSLAEPYTWSFTTGNMAGNGGNTTVLSTPIPSPTVVPSPTSENPGILNRIPLVAVIIGIIAVGVIAIFYFWRIRK